jgi:hypothetical protein
MAEHIGSVQAALDESAAASGTARERLRASLAPVARPADLPRRRPQARSA